MSLAPDSPVFRVFAPEAARLPLVFDSPHSGTVLPPDFGAACPLADLRRVEDSWIDDLFADAPRYGAALLTARIHRAYIDLNRAEGDIDAHLLAGEWSERLAPSHRSEAGIGLIHRLIRPGVPIYDRRLTPAEIRARIDGVWRPYHAALRALLDDAHRDFGQVWHINAHAMPGQSGWGGPDIVLGDRDGSSCGPGFREAVRKILAEMGYRVAVNDPYKGVELVRRYADPAAGRHSLQIEISKALYMDEDAGTRTAGYARLRRDLDSLCRGLAAHVAQNLDRALAAD